MQIEYKSPRALNANLLNIAIVALVFILYAPLIIHWCDGWLNKSIGIEHEYFSHGLIGLPYAAYVTWTQRQQWQRLPDKAHPAGLFLLGLGAVFFLSGVTEWVNLSFPIVLAGICLSWKGIAGGKLQGLPLLLVFLATPNSIPYLITPYTLPLQQFIASCAGLILIQFGLDVRVEQIYLFVGERITEVAPYCAGLKMLFTTFYVALMLLHWTGNLQSRRKTIALFAAAASISVFGDIIRNTVLTFFHGTGREQMFVWLHDGWGGDIYSAATLIFLIPLLSVIEKFYSELDNRVPGASE